MAELAVASTLSAPLVRERTARIKNLYAVVEGIAHVDVPGQIQGDTVRAPELAFSRTSSTPTGEERAGGAEDLDAIVHRVGDIDFRRETRSHRDSLGALKLSLPVAAATPREWLDWATARPEKEKTRIQKNAGQQCRCMRWIVERERRLVVGLTGSMVAKKCKTNPQW